MSEPKLAYKSVGLERNGYYVVMFMIPGFPDPDAPDPTHNHTILMPQIGAILCESKEEAEEVVANHHFGCMAHIIPIVSRKGVPYVTDHRR